jgi:hypothetical protein
MLQRVAIPSPNYSSRGGTSVRLIVLHTAEGALTIESLGAFFANPASGVSSHTGIDDKYNTVGEYVRRDYKAWTQANANPYSVAAELCAFAAWSPNEWGAHSVMLDNCAQWIAEEAAAFGIPIVRLSAAQAQGGAAGVCQHVDLGASGGNHWDCGPSFPMDQVIAQAAGGAPTAPPIEEESNMKVISHSDGRAFITDGVVKRYIGEPTMELPDLLRMCGQTGPMSVADYTVDRMPEIIPVDTPESTKVDLENIDRGANQP